MSTCRACNLELENLVPLFKTYENSEFLSILFTDVTEIELSVTDDPNHICLQCVEELKTAYYFKKRCRVIEASRKKEYAQYEEIIIKTEITTSKNEEVKSPILNIITNKNNLNNVSGNLCIDNIEIKSEDSLSQSYSEDNIEDEIFNSNLQNDTAEVLQKILFNENSKTKHKEYACLICENIFSDANLLRTHISDVHCVTKVDSKEDQKPKVKRSVLQSENFQKLSLPRRRKTESLKKQLSVSKSPSKRVFKCVLCDLQFSKNDSYKKHLDTHNPTKRIASPGFTKLSIPPTTDPIVRKPTQCIFCHLVLSDLKEWRDHERTHASEEKPYRCNYDKCTTSFKNRSALKSHYNTHTQVRPYQCNYCTKRFNQRGNASAHERMHTGAKPYLCSDCGKAFRESGHLKQHMRQHTGEKPFDCHLCTKHFSTLYSRKVHVRTHLQDKPYLCSECGKSFVASGKLLIHKRIHSGYRPYVCTLCSSAFHDGNGLKRHMKTH